MAPIPPTDPEFDASHSLRIRFRLISLLAFVTAVSLLFGLARSVGFATLGAFVGNFFPVLVVSILALVVYTLCFQLPVGWIMKRLDRSGDREMDDN